MKGAEQGTDFLHTMIRCYVFSKSDGDYAYTAMSAHGNESKALDLFVYARFMMSMLLISSEIALDLPDFVQWCSLSIAYLTDRIHRA